MFVYTSIFSWVSFLFLLPNLLLPKINLFVLFFPRFNRAHSIHLRDLIVLVYGILDLISFYKLFWIILLYIISLINVVTLEKLLLILVNGFFIFATRLMTI